VQIDLQKLLNYLLLALAVCGGFVAGLLSGRLIDLSLGGGALLLPEPLTRQVRVRQLQEQDFQVILDRNLFDSEAAGSGGQVDLSLTELPGQATAAARPVGELVLIGTVVAGDGSLALLRVGRKVAVYRLNDELAAGTRLIEIMRNRVVVRAHGQRRELLIKPSKDTKSRLVRRGSNARNKSGIVASGRNRWQISRVAAERARADFSSLLRTARMIPQVKNGQTIGFKLVEMEKGSLTEQVGLRVGDLLVEINQVPLNSPEKALQIFQQIREANNISLGLVRNGKRETFEYSFE
jgi:general secretion pathway protein C